MRNDIRRSEKAIAAVLRFGSGLSTVLMAAGLVLLLVEGQLDTLQGTRFVGLHSLLAGAASLQPLAIMTLGVLMLLLTPMLRVIAAGISFLIFERDVKYAIISLGVLVILIVSFFVPGFK